MGESLPAKKASVNKEQAAPVAKRGLALTASSDENITRNINAMEEKAADNPTTEPRNKYLLLVNARKMSSLNGSKLQWRQ